MQLHEVDEIKELFAVGEVNDALSSGWRIVAVVSSVSPGGDLPVACYVMGRYFPKDDRLQDFAFGKTVAE
ncbi:hypothetical protein [Pseudomonas syringae]|uniref:hypothetical protein n=1 Tax=Pseudomonas syringae TaxID=317 RepID=UPI000E31EC4E|nr:hypothetical protein [Pseudomonas syringae]